MKIDSSIRLHHGLAMSRPDINAMAGILGIYCVGIFLTWYPLSFMDIPMPDGLVQKSAFTAIWQTVTTIVLPYVWVMQRLGFRLADLGISLRKLGQSLLLGSLLYSLALAAFIHCAADPLISNHALRHLAPWEAAGLVSSMSLIAAGTDFCTRGFILLTLARYTHLGFAILAQNLTWYLGHITEIKLLTGCLGYGGALGLTLTLGLLGDVIALKTRNVLGLAIAHILLNIIMTLFIRQL